MTPTDSPMNPPLIMMWRYGAPARPVSFSWWMIRWVRGVVMFGGVMLTGAAIGRLAPFPDNPVPLRPPAQ